MHLRYAILALLADGETHGYQLVKRFHARLGPFWHPNVGQIYQLLQELERRGLVTRRDDTSSNRMRRCFRLTARGERALRTFLTRRPAWPPPVRDEMLIRVLAAERDGTPALLDQLTRQESEYQRYVENVREHATQSYGVTTSLSRRLADAAALTQAEAYLAWLQRCRAVLEEQQQLAS